MVPMAGARTKTARIDPAGNGIRRRQEQHAHRAETPHACGCGLPVAFDPERHEFFCIGCGEAGECVCRKSLLSSVVRPVNVV